MSSTFLDDLARALADSQAQGLLSEDLGFSGFSGRKILGLLQRLAVLPSLAPDSCYLEVGVFQGLTLLSVAKAAPERKVCGIDNFSQFDPDGTNRTLVMERRRALGAENALLIDRDYEDALEQLPSHLGGQRVGVYFVDGPHDYRSQLMCLLLALPHLAKEAVVVIDDCNYLHVRQANRDFLLTRPEFKLAFEAYTPGHPCNMTAEAEAQARAGWWNGVNVLVRDPENALPAIYPPTSRSRRLYENEHLVHAARFGVCAPEAVRVASALGRLDPFALVLRLAKLFWRARTAARAGVGPYETANTFSSELPVAHFNPGLAPSDPHRG